MRTAKEMRAVFENWERSGLNQKAFAAREGISYTIMQYWRRRLKEIDAAANGVEFTPVHVTESAPSSKAHFDLHFAGGIKISVPAGFDADSLRRLIATVRSC